MNEWVYWIALNKVRGMGGFAVKNLLSAMGTPERIFHASRDEILGISGIGKKTYECLRSFSGWNEAEEEVKRITENGLRLITVRDSEYPPNLKNIFNPPPYLYIKGELDMNDINPVAVVGSRLCDHYGIRMARKLTAGLAESGVTIISGMAMGIDAVAHGYCIKNGGRTIGVLGNGVDVIYPRENRELYEVVPRNGALVSEFPLGTSPESTNFPQRNRVISGISVGVVVIQASEKSGSLITATFASEQNREVFAVPGNVNSRLSAGTNMLIKKGAKLVENTDDILEEIIQLRDRAGRQKRQVENIQELQGDERKVLDLLSSKTYHIDKITEKMDIEPSNILAVLLELELKGIVEQLPGKYFKIA